MTPPFSTPGSDPPFCVFPIGYEIWSQPALYFHSLTVYSQIWGRFVFLFCQKKICNSCTLDFEGQRAASVKLVSLLRPFIYPQGWALWTPFDPWVVFWSSFGILKNQSPCCMQIRSCLVRYSSSAEYQGERGLICSSVPSVLTDC